MHRKKNWDRRFEAELVLNLFIDLSHFEARCSYEIVLIENEECMTLIQYQRNNSNTNENDRLLAGGSSNGIDGNRPFC